jgi:hypothetical protein
MNLIVLICFDLIKIQINDIYQYLFTHKIGSLCSEMTLAQIPLRLDFRLTILITKKSDSIDFEVNIN